MTLYLLCGHMRELVFPVIPHFFIDMVVKIHLFLKHFLEILDIMDVSLEIHHVLETSFITNP